MRIYCTILLLLVVVIPNAASAQECSAALPKIVQHAEPLYPPLARTAHITGEVRLKITTDGESVGEVEIEEGHPLLRKASEDNAKTWRFFTHKPGCFRVTFRYKISSGKVEAEFFESSGVVELNAPAPEVSIYYADIGLGTWKARLKSDHGEMSLVLDLYYTGPTGESLGVRVVRNQNAEEHDDDDIEFGHREGDFLVFALKLSQPDRSQLKTFLVGKMKGNKIVGTFVDDAGVTGKWTAAKISD